MFDLFCFFFFQAEDGIRDRTVTGVQTCALPITRSEGSSCSRRSRAGRGRSGTAAPARSEERRVGKECRSRWSPHHYKKKLEAIHALIAMGREHNLTQDQTNRDDNG